MELDFTVIALATPMTMAVVQAAKSAGLPSRFAPLLSLAVGATAGCLLGAVGMGGIASGIIAGFVSGASAAGIWSGTKAVTQGQ